MLNVIGHKMASLLFTLVLMGIQMNCFIRLSSFLTLFRLRMGFQIYIRFHFGHQIVNFFFMLEVV